MEDNYTNIRQLISLINYLADDCNIIFRPSFYDCDYYNYIDKRVMFYNEKQAVPNVARFASDWIICGVLGTFFSSVMLGLPVIPVYSRIIYPKGEVYTKYKNAYPKKIENKFFIKYLDYIEQMKNCEAYPHYKYVFNNWKYIFDLAQKKKIRQAIFEESYKLWYINNLKLLQNCIFGDYILDNADKRTAEYILRFCNDGTLGNDCVSVYVYK